MEVRGDRFPGVGVSSNEGFEAGFQEEGKDIKPGVNEGFDGIGFPGARGAHDQHICSRVDRTKIRHLYFPMIYGHRLLQRNLAQNKEFDGHHLCNSGPASDFGALQNERERFLTNYL